jgi:hypothetical protein
VVSGGQLFGELAPRGWYFQSHVIAACVYTQFPGEGYIPLDGMLGFGTDSDVIEDPRSFAGVAESGSQGGSARPGEDPAAQEPLQIYDPVEPGAAERAKQSHEFCGGGNASPGAAEAFASEKYDLIQLRIIADQGGAIVRN